jgi:hypothetical protein
MFKAITFRLFANTNHPLRTLLVRFLWGVAGFLILGLLLFRFTPDYLAALIGRYEVSAQLALVVLIVNAVSGALYVLLHAPYQTFAARTDILEHYAITRVQARLLRLYAFLPIIAITIGISIPVALKVFDHHILVIAVVVVTAIVCAAAHALLRITGYMVVAQIYALVHAGVACAVLQQAFALEAHVRMVVFVGFLLILVHMLAIATQFWRAVPHIARQRVHRRVIEYDKVGLVPSLAIRAVRTSRFVTANLFLFIVVTLLVVVAKRSPQIIPFDAVVVLGLLLAGTMAQEVRCLSSKLYPTEHIFYGLVGKWAGGIWMAAYANMLLVIGVLLMLAVTVFDGQLGTSQLYVVCFGLCLVSVGIAAAAVIVPQHNDILSQLGTTVIYGVMVWGVFKAISPIDAANTLVLAAVTTGIIGASLAVSYISEKVRWIRTIRGLHGKLF